VATLDATASCAGQLGAYAIKANRKSCLRSTIHGRRLEVNLCFFGRLMITEAIAAASKSSKSRWIPTDVDSSRFGELDRVCEVFVAINASSFRCADVSRRIFQLIELCSLNPTRISCTTSRAGRTARPEFKP
jgi:hypothetical protein